MESSSLMTLSKKVLAQGTQDMMVIEASKD